MEMRLPQIHGGQLKKIVLQIALQTQQIRMDEKISPLPEVGLLTIVLSTKDIIVLRERMPLGVEPFMFQMYGLILMAHENQE